MTEEAERLVSSLESGHRGIETFLKLPADDRATIMAMLEQRAGAKEIRQILEQCEADGTMDKIRALLAEQRKKTGEGVATSAALCQSSNFGQSARKKPSDEHIRQSMSFST